MNESFKCLKDLLKKRDISADFLTRIYTDQVNRCDLLTLREKHTDILSRFKKMLNDTTMDENRKNEIKDAYERHNSIIRKICNEIDTNIWYFLSEIVEIPHDCYNTTGKPPFDIYISGKNPLRKNEMQIAIWMLMYFTSVQHEFPIMISGFSNMDMELCVAVHMVYEYIRYILIPTNIVGVRKEYKTWMLLYGGKPHFADKNAQRISYLFNRVLEETIDQWGFIFSIERDLFSFNDKNPINSILKIKYIDQVIGNQAKLENIIGSYNTIVFGSITLDEFIKIIGIRQKYIIKSNMIIWGYTEIIRSLVYNADIRMLNELYLIDRERSINLMTGNKVRPIYYGTTLDDYKEINKEKIGFIKKHIDIYVKDHNIYNKNELLPSDVFGFDYTVSELYN